MAAPEARAVVVDGPGPLATEVAHQLRRVGAAVRAGALAADAELTGVAAAAPPALVVLVRDRPVPVWAGLPWQVRAVPHLPVETGVATTTVGPLVVPGRSPCLTCVARRRPAAAPFAAAPAADPAVRVLAAAVVTVTALALLRGDVRLAGISTEIAPSVETVTHRLWHVEAGCRCASVTMAS